jgi:hypothetical protein
MAFTYTKAQLKNVLVDKKIYDGTDDDGDFYYILECRRQVRPRPWWYISS